MVCRVARQNSRNATAGFAVINPELANAVVAWESVKPSALSGCEKQEGLKPDRADWLSPIQPSF